MNTVHESTWETIGSAPVRTHNISLPLTSIRYSTEQLLVLEVLGSAVNFGLLTVSPGSLLLS
jgi:hypothetical protein